MCDCGFIQLREDFPTVLWASVEGEIILYLLKTLCFPPYPLHPILPLQCPSFLNFQAFPIIIQVFPFLHIW